jgi:hypothetical protein
MRIKDNKGKSEGLSKLNMKPEGYIMLTVEAEYAFQVK